MCNCLALELRILALSPGGPASCVGLGFSAGGLGVWVISREKMNLHRINLILYSVMCKSKRYVLVSILRGFYRMLELTFKYLPYQVNSVKCLLFIYL